MKYREAFPDFDRASEIDELIAAGWQDHSWRNDGCPRVHCGEAVIWIDYLDPDKSEIAAMGGEAGQCALEFLRGGMFTGVDPVAFPTIKDALAAIYQSWIGYDPFAPEGGWTFAEVIATLPEYAAEAGAAA